MTIILDNLPANVTEALAKRAKLEGKSLQDVTAEAVVRDVTIKKRDLSHYRGKWIEDPAVDAALKAADVRIAGFFNPPLNTTNIAGAIMVGTQSACKAACDAFAEACIYVANNPLEL